MDYRILQRHYEACFLRHGDTHLGMDWPKAEHVAVRNEVMLEGICAGQRVLDFGCGLGSLVPLAEARGLGYRGVDISPAFVEACRRKFPGREFAVADLLAGDKLPECDYVVANGVFTEKRELKQSEMESFLRRCLGGLFASARVGVRFNVMSAHVDYQRPDLFHVPFDRMAEILAEEASRHFRFRADYGLYEYTVYVSRDPVPTPGSDPVLRPVLNA